MLFVQSSGPGLHLCLHGAEELAGDLWPWLQDGTGTLAGDCGSGSRAIDPAFWGLNWEHCEVSDPEGPTITLRYMTHVNNPPDWRQDEHDETYVRHAQTRLKLATGGRAVPGRQSLIRITGWATEVPHKRAVPPFSDCYDCASWPAIPPEQIQVGTLGKLDANGELWLVLPDGDPDATPEVHNGPDYYAFFISGTKYTLVHQTEKAARSNPDRNRTKVGVYEHVKLYFNPTLPINIDWENTVGILAQGSGLSAADPKWWWAGALEDGGKVTVTAIESGKHLDVPFEVVKPSGIHFVHPPLGVQHIYNTCDAGFHAQVVILPTDVSFCNIDISEMHTNAIGTGCYAFCDHNPDYDHKNWTEQGIPPNGWLQPDDNNNLPTIVDYCEGPVIDPPFTNGGTFKWNIPWNYKGHGHEGDGDTFKTITQTTTATSAGNCTISKADMTTNFPADHINVYMQ